MKKTTKNSNSQLLSEISMLTGILSSLKVSQCATAASKVEALLLVKIDQVK